MVFIDFLHLVLSDQNFKNLSAKIIELFKETHKKISPSTIFPHFQSKLRNLPQEQSAKGKNLALTNISNLLFNHQRPTSNHEGGEGPAPHYAHSSCQYQSSLWPRPFLRLSSHWNLPHDLNPPSN